MAQTKAQFVKAYVQANGSSALAELLAAVAAGQVDANDAIGGPDGSGDAMTLKVSSKADEATLAAFRSAGYTVRQVNDKTFEVDADPATRRQAATLLKQAEAAWVEEEKAQKAALDKTEQNAADTGDAAAQKKIDETMAGTSPSAGGTVVGGVPGMDLPTDGTVPSATAGKDQPPIVLTNYIGGMENLAVDPVTQEPVAGYYVKGDPAQYRRDRGLPESDQERLLHRATPDRRPMYEEGDELQGAGWEADKIGRIQAKLVEAGYLQKGTYRPRMWDPKTAGAFKELLAQSNVYGRNWRWTLDQSIESARANPNLLRDPNVQPLTYSLPDPDELGLVAERVSAEVLGRKFTDQERQAFIETYSAQERARQKAVYEADTSGMEGTVSYQAVDPNAAAELFARRRDPGGYEAQGAADLYTKLLDFIGVSYG